MTYTPNLNPSISRRPSAGSSPDVFSTVKYMGSKRALIGDIVARVTRQAAPGALVVDLFAGTHTLGYALRNRNPTLAVDVQLYSSVIGNALLGDRYDSKLDAELRAAQRSNQRALEEIFADALAREQKLVAAVRERRPRSVEKYAAFQRSLPDPTKWSSGELKRQSTPASLEHLVMERRQDPGAFPYLMCAAYYANAYFGIRQAITLDSLRYAIDQVLPDGCVGRQQAMLALLTAASHSTSTPGHFAMWRQARTDAGTLDLVSYRLRDPNNYFWEQLDRLALLERPNFEHRAIVGEAESALSFVNDHRDAVGCVYLDPPYSAVHYSRFYHVLEELVGYSYPEVFFGGRFPAARFSSDYSVRNKAEPALARLLAQLAEAEVPAVLSYSTAGVVPVPNLVATCQDSYGNSGIRVEHLRTRHSSMGRADRGARNTTEIVVTCLPDKRVRRAHAASAQIATRSVVSS